MDSFQNKKLYQKINHGDSSYIKFWKESNHSRKGLINIQSTNNRECLKW